MNKDFDKYYDMYNRKVKELKAIRQRMTVEPRNKEKR